jgi:hypothetical protein
VRARGSWPEEARAAATGARPAWDGERRGRTGRAPVGARAMADVGWVCGPGKDDVGGQAREDGGQVRAAAVAEAGARRVGGGQGVAGGRAEAGARRQRACGSWWCGSESSERERVRGAWAFF